MQDSSDYNDNTKRGAVFVQCCYLRGSAESGATRGRGGFELLQRHSTTGKVEEPTSRRAYRNCAYTRVTLCLETVLWIETRSNHYICYLFRPSTIQRLPSSMSVSTLMVMSAVCLVKPICGSVR